ncbi:tRNA pseudouridine synthase D [Thalassoglobus neptunius]|uniref:tRNA pseudouridine synthase D n=1 Tax=Thalassoglobus neptunius TaxID=1938619 RepID=A0A5C5X510_9PLAN|nr:tRNA pseudouridine(13) synthase TruD [Thalassoglobus neptunius]TWT57411.1 tRNA pseudouridine synthase D [Thalassoglobus neptunius]
METLSQQLQAPLPYLTEEVQGIQGTLKTAPSDFRVDEIPLYLPSGEGTHLYLKIEKTGVSSEQLLMHLAKVLEVARREIGVAGLKDRQAVTRQWVSVPENCESRIPQIDTDAIRVLQVSRHGNKLKTGHLVGNRFEIVVRDVASDALARAQQIRDMLLQSGVPNFFGTQRFGIDSETLETGEKLLRGTLSPQSIPPQRRKFLVRLALSSVQSALFNLVLSERLRNGCVHQVRKGDVLQVVRSGGPFISDDPETDQQRFDQREVVTTGPLFGPKMKQPVELPGREEAEILERSQFTPEHFKQFKKLTPGARRPLIIWLEELEVDPFDGGLRFRFDLPSGVYATMVLREFMKNDVN